MRTFVRDDGECNSCGCRLLQSAEVLAIGILLKQGDSDAAYEAFVRGKPIVADHIKPHRGDERLFWDEANLQTLCKPCHDTIKQAEEQATLNQRGVWH